MSCYGLRREREIGRLTDKNILQKTIFRRRDVCKPTTHFGFRSREASVSLCFKAGGTLAELK